ncbi:MAG: hypothetical protein UY07_C0013G0002 [Parcubacteria group bacterium GW2011_GWA1_47_8]|nr:MAG: hypothetical protein UY07_C0013G0002 [Parcubacteria group bacterium GW2011_GWA1_47_8]KKW07815.1 MAG: hypothetical protein UY42_C0005G0002 [Parcubacteria group bacterium GW2011_GWA2_49_16]
MRKIIGGILVLVGALMFLQNIGWIAEISWGLIWSLILILIGVKFLVGYHGHYMGMCGGGKCRDILCDEGKE